jgi:hypothetical protein
MFYQIYEYNQYDQSTIIYGKIVSILFCCENLIVISAMPFENKPYSLTDLERNNISRIVSLLLTIESVRSYTILVTIANQLSGLIQMSGGDMK